MQKYLQEIAQETKSYFPEILEACGETLKKNIALTKHYNNIDNIKTSNKALVNPNHKTQVKVFNKDTLDCASDLIDEKYNPLVLNMASNYKPGGGFEKGSSAQEEELFRRTTYALSLYKPDIKSCYPLNGTACIYSPNLLIFRGSRADDYYVMKWKDCKYASFIAMPAIRKPNLCQNILTKEWELRKLDTELMLDKIRTIFEVAKANGHDSLVLGALGNGAYDNPPAHTAKLFKQVIFEYNGWFKYITFAIISDHNDKYGNFGIYNQILTV